MISETGGLFVYMQVGGWNRLYQDSKISMSKTGKKREKRAVVWSVSRRISCLQGGPGYKAMKGNALKRKRERGQQRSFLIPDPGHAYRLLDLLLWLLQQSKESSSVWNVQSKYTCEICERGCRDRSSLCEVSLGHWAAVWRGHKPQSVGVSHLQWKAETQNGIIAAVCLENKDKRAVKEEEIYTEQ